MDADYRSIFAIVKFGQSYDETFTAIRFSFYNAEICYDTLLKKRQVETVANKEKEEQKI